MSGSMSSPSLVKDIMPRMTMTRTTMDIVTRFLSEKSTIFILFLSGHDDGRPVLQVVAALDQHEVAGAHPERTSKRVWFLSPTVTARLRATPLS